MFEPVVFIPILYAYCVGLTAAFVGYITKSISMFIKIEKADIKAKVQCGSFIFACIAAIGWMYKACIFTEKVPSHEVLVRMYSTSRMNGMIVALVTCNILLLLLGWLREKHPSKYGFKEIEKKQKHIETR